MFHYSYLLQLHGFHLFQLPVPERGVLVSPIMVIEIYTPLLPFLNIAQVILRLQDPPVKPEECWEQVCAATPCFPCNLISINFMYFFLS